LISNLFLNKEKQLSPLNAGCQLTLSGDSLQMVHWKYDDLKKKLLMLLVDMREIAIKFPNYLLNVT